MKILSIDTAMAACSAALLDTETGGVLAAAAVPMERGHAEALPPMVRGVMNTAGLGLGEIDRIAVTVGPGTFTGVRIGLSFARGLGLARGIPVIGIDTLSAIAANETVNAPLLVASDARNGEFYVAAFDAGGLQIAPPHVSTGPAAAATVPPGARVLGTASRAVLLGSGRNDLILSDAGDLPVAAHFGRLAASAEAGVMPLPLYLRAPDARPQSVPLRRIGTLKIERVGSTGAQLLSELHCEIFDEGWSANAFADLLDTPGAEAAIASEAGEALAFVVTRTAADEAEIILIGTRPSLQRRGVARQLLEHHVKSMQEKAVRHLFLEVAASNTAGQALYQALGFGEAGRRKSYYKRPDGFEDAIVMRRDLQP